MSHELDRLDRDKQTGREPTSPYAALLLANLNMCEKYIKLEDKYIQIKKELELLKSLQKKPLDSPGRSCSATSVEQVTSPALNKPTENEIQKPTGENAGEKQSRDISDTEKPIPRREENNTEEKVETPRKNEHPPANEAEKIGRALADWRNKRAEPEFQKTDPCSLSENQNDSPTGSLSPPASAPNNSTLQDGFSLAESETQPLKPEKVPTPSEASSTIPEPARTSFPINRPGANYHHVVNKEVQDNGKFQLPTLSFLKISEQETEIDQQGIRRDAELLEQKLGYFGIKGEVMGVSPGPVITTFEYKPAPGIKISKIVNLADDLALALSAFSIRIVAPIPGKDVMGIEIPNEKKSLVPFIDIVSSDDFINSQSQVPICLGKDIVGNPVVVELDTMPHLLIAGATGTGKSVALNTMITSILYKSTPDEVKFLMIDPKRIELSFYNEIPHLITPVVTDMKKANIALQWMVREMERRYDLLADMKVRNIEQYNEMIKNTQVNHYDSETHHTELPYFVIIIDELADLMMTASRDIEFSLTRLAQMARAAGIHLILATQRPSVDVLTGIIKANFPTRISFQISSKTDSRTIIDSNGAETLLGKGDMLFVPPGTASLTRVHGTYLSEKELVDITDFIKAQRKPDYVLEVISEKEEEPDTYDVREDEYDEKYNEALQYVMTTRQASISGIQRALRVGYNRAARIIDLMEKKGIVGPSDGVKPRQVLTGNLDSLE